MKKATITLAGLPAVLSIAGMRLSVCYSSTSPSPLAANAVILRRTKDRTGRTASRYWRTSRRGGFRLWWAGIGTFVLDARRGRVICSLIRGSSRGAVEEVLRGPVCAFFLLEKGLEPLHAGAVVLDGRCVALAGNPGAGKSSLVAWMSRHGAQFFCDDILPLRQRGRAIWGHPGLPQIRLEPPAAREMGWREPRSAERIRRDPKGKSKFRMVPSRGPRPVARIYLLERRPSKRELSDQGNPAAGSVEIRRLEPRQAFRALLKSTRNDSLDTPERLRRQMRLFAHLARTVPVCRLCYPSGFAAFPAVLERVRQDLA